jgi:geranylgeranyl reductase family protein
VTVRACDVLVVGLGPAGAAAARAAARAGVSVIAVDRRRVIGEPVQCAELIPLPLGAHAQAPSVVRQSVRRMRTHLPSGTCDETVQPGLIVDRAAFDRALAEAAVAAGAELLAGTALVALDAARRVATLRAVGGAPMASDASGTGGLAIAPLPAAASLEIHYRLLVAADGPLSRVAALLGLPPLPTILTRQYRVGLRQPRDATEVWLSGEYPGGYAWLFPRGAEANLGVGVDPRLGGDMKAALDGLHARLVAAGVVDAGVVLRTGGAIPVGGLRAALARGDVLFAGDAGGFTHPISGAGIAAAVESGAAAGEACGLRLGGDGAACEDYEAGMREQFGPTLARGLRARRRLEGEWGAPAAGGDAVQKRGWIAYREYYAS